jgi:hypothetical protein
MQTLVYRTYLDGHIRSIRGPKVLCNFKDRSSLSARQGEREQSEQIGKGGRLKIDERYCKTPDPPSNKQSSYYSKPTILY